MPLHTVEPLRLYRQIAGQIGKLIDDGEFLAGSRLPAERELASLLGVSRTSVREAVISLEIAGRVEVRVGAGIFVTSPPVDALIASTDEGPSPFELLAARRLVEGEIAALAAPRITATDVAALRKTVQRMRENAGDFSRRDAADREFHLRVASASGNGSLVLVVQGLWQQRRGKLWSRIVEHFHTRKMTDAVLVDHTAIIDALERHDPEGARTAMQRHLARVEREFQRQWDANAPPSETRRIRSR